MNKKFLTSIIISLILSGFLATLYWFKYDKPVNKFKIISEYKNVPQFIITEAIAQFFNENFGDLSAIKSNDSLDNNIIKTTVFIYKEINQKKLKKELTDYLLNKSVAAEYSKNKKILSYKISGIYKVKKSNNIDIYNTFAIFFLSLLLFLGIFFFKRIIFLE